MLVDGGGLVLIADREIETACEVTQSAESPVQQQAPRRCYTAARMGMRCVRCSGLVRSMPSHSVARHRCSDCRSTEGQSGSGKLVPHQHSSVIFNRGALFSRPDDVAG